MTITIPSPGDVARRRAARLQHEADDTPVYSTSTGRAPVARPLSNAQRAERARDYAKAVTAWRYLFGLDTSYETVGCCPECHYGEPYREANEATNVIREKYGRAADMDLWQATSDAWIREHDTE